jgi:CHAT domain-containing protein
MSLRHGFQCKVRRRALAGAALLAFSWLAATAQQRELALGASVEESLMADANHSYRVRLNAGQCLTLALEGFGAPVAVKVYAPNNEGVADTSAIAHALPQKTLCLVAQQNGEYRVELRNLHTATAGRYRLKLERLAIATAADRQRAGAERAYETAWRWRAQKTAEASRQALEKLAEALALWRAAGDKHHEALALLDQGAVALTLGEKASAFESLNQALPLWRSLQEHSWEATTFNTLGSLHLSNGEFQRALDDYRQSLSLSRAHGQPKIEAFALSNLGLAYQALGQPSQAIEHYLAALALNRKLGDREREAVSLHNLGESYLASGDYQRALEFCGRALPLHRALNDRGGEAHTLEHLGTARFRLGEPRQALEFFTQALAARRALGHRQPEAAVLGDLAAVHAALRQPEQARAHFQQALSRAREVKARGIEARMLAGLARLDRDAGRWREARAQIEAALNITHALRTKIGDSELRASYFAVKRDYDEFYIDLLMRERATGHEAVAFAASERARARSLLDLLAEHKIALPVEATAQPLPLAALQALLEPRAALLEYVLGRERSFLFVVTKTGLHSVVLPAAGELAPLVLELRAALRAPGRRELGRYQSAARRLYEALLAPAEQWLRDRQSLLIAPDGALHYLPFEALLSDGQEPSFLLHRWAISYTPSASVLANLQQRQPAAFGKEFLAFADPVYAGGLRRLTASGYEANHIAQLYRSADTAVYLRHAASAAAVKNNAHLAAARRLHFATHGRMNDQPSGSGLWLSPTSPAEDGLLQVADIFGLKLQADLVTLSACETGLGPELKGEGVMGLARAFLFAGAASVAVSLWQVDDAATAALMVKFYERMQRGEAKAAALRQAKLELLADGTYAHPNYWAAFVLNGQP